LTIGGVRSFGHDGGAQGMNGELAIYFLLELPWHRRCCIAASQDIPFGIAVDATNVFWTNEGSGPKLGTVMSAPIGGGAPTTLASGQPTPRAIAIDANNDGAQFDRLLADSETLEAGALRVDVIATPGHTPACVTYRMGDAIFTGDALFVED
jgi:hypothetical protein